MKRVGHIYEYICSRDNIAMAIYKASQGKSNRNYVRKILENVEYYIDKIQNMLINESYIFRTPKEKIIYDNSCNKERLIKVPRFYPDQIIHWCLMLQLEPILEKGMYEFCCGSVNGRGGLYAKKYVEKNIKDEKAKYCAKLDISKFFNSVKPKYVLQMLERKVKDEKVISLVSKILESGGDCLPIGYYTSQGLSNFVLQDLDHYVKEELKIKFYVRYVDDMVLMESNKRKLRNAIDEIERFLETKELSLKPSKEIFKLGVRPIDFVGFRFYKDKIILRKKIYYRLLRRIRNVVKLNYITIKQAMGILSLLGWLKHINARNLYIKRIKPFANKSKLTSIISNFTKRRNEYGIQKGIMVGAN